MQRRNSWVVTVTVLGALSAAPHALAIQAVINRATIDTVETKRQAEFLEVTLHDTKGIVVTRKGEDPQGKEYGITAAVGGGNEIIIRHTPKPALRKSAKTEHQPTAVIFVNKIKDRPVFIRVQPDGARTKALCAKKMGLTDSATFCATATVSNTTFCAELDKTLKSCAEDPLLDIGAAPVELSPDGTFEMRFPVSTATKPASPISLLISAGETDAEKKAREDAKPPLAAPVPTPQLFTLIPDPNLDTKTHEITLEQIPNVAVVPLDSAGVASWQYANPLNPACLGCDPQRRDAEGLFSAAHNVQIAFYNRTIDRFFVVALPIPKTLVASLNARGLTRCSDENSCTVSVTIGPGTSGVFGAPLIDALPDDQLLRFDVRFLDESERPANPSAYLSKLPAFPEDNEISKEKQKEVKELDDKSEFHTIGKMGASTDPAVTAVLKQSDAKPKFSEAPCRYKAADSTTIDPFAPGICANQPYNGERRHHYPGQVRLELRQNLGSRADVLATLSYRETDLGGTDDAKLAVNQFLINVYSRIGTGFQFGRTTFLDSANKIALSEKGDGYRWILRVPKSSATGSLTHLVKRESLEGKSDFGNRDADEWITQIRGITFTALQPKSGGRSPLNILRSADIVFLRGNETAQRAGEDDKTLPLSPRSYRTFGGEIFYGFSNLSFGNLGGSVAAFSSKRNVAGTDGPCDTTLCDGRGSVALFTMTWSPKATSTDNFNFTARRSVSILLGRGSGDRASTPLKDEGYLGETAAFAPDVLFLGSFASVTDTVQHHIIGPSLSNKNYLGLTYTENSYSPLAWIARKLGTPDADIISKAMIFKLHDYRFREPVNGSRDAAREFDIDLQIETPKGITLTISAAYLWPGSAVETLIRKRSWALSGSVSLRL
jgi:hypothetical protein